MNNHLRQNMGQLNVPVPIRVGTTVILKEYVVTDNGEKVAKTTFEDTVERLVPETALIEFETHDTGMHEFKTLCDEADSITVRPRA